MGRTPKGCWRSESKASYETFCKAHPTIHITFEQFRSVILTYNKMVRDHVLETGDKFRFPFGFGDISIRKWKKKKINTLPDGRQFIAMAVDWKKTKEIGKKVYLLNNHTDGFRLQWKWFRKTAIFESHSIFVFRPSRETSRKIPEILRKNPNHYHKYREW